MTTDNLGSTQDSSTRAAADFDAETLRARYREERDKRIRDDGTDQYLEVKGDLAHFYPHMLNEQAKHITYIPGHATRNKVQTIERRASCECF